MPRLVCTVEHMPGSSTQLGLECRLVGMPTISTGEAAAKAKLELQIRTTSTPQLILESWNVVPSSTSTKTRTWNQTSSKTGPPHHARLATLLKRCRA